MTPTPRDVADLHQQYDRFITGCIVRLSQKPMQDEDLDDVKQQVLLRVLDKRCLDTFNPDKAQFTTYLYCVIRTVVFALRNRSTFDPLAAAVPIEDGSGSDPVLAETFHDLADDSLERRQIAVDFNTRFERYLETVALDCRASFRGLVTLPDGSQRPYGFALVFHLLREDYTPADIARILHMTPQNVWWYVRRIKLEVPRFLHPEQSAVPTV